MIKPEPVEYNPELDRWFEPLPTDKPGQPADAAVVEAAEAILELSNPLRGRRAIVACLAKEIVATITHPIAAAERKKVVALCNDEVVKLRAYIKRDCQGDDPVKEYARVHATGRLDEAELLIRRLSRGGT